MTEWAIRIQLKPYIIYPIAAVAAAPVPDSPFQATQKWHNISIGSMYSTEGRDSCIVPSQVRDRMDDVG